MSFKIESNKNNITFIASGMNKGNIIKEIDKCLRGKLGDLKFNLVEGPERNMFTILTGPKSIVLKNENRVNLLGMKIIKHIKTNIGTEDAKIEKLKKILSNI
jgi:hypothetical protein